MLKAILNCSFCILRDLRAIHWLQVEVGKIQVLKASWIAINLWVNELQLVASNLNELGANLGADADPVDAFGCGNSSVGFDRHFEALLMKGFDKQIIDLKQWFAASTDDIGAPTLVFPGLGYGSCEITRVGKLAPSGSIGAHKVGIAEPTDGQTTVNFSSTPQVASGKATEDCWSTGLGALSLECVEQLFDRVGHDSTGSR